MLVRDQTPEPAGSLKIEQESLKGRRMIRSEELFASEREIVIVHGESQYRLLITKAGKLILNK